MLRAENYSRRGLLLLIGGLLLAAGCAELNRVSVTDLRPGCYCEIEMAVPPNAADGSQHCYMGWVKEVSHDEVVLTNVMEQTNIDYNGSGHRRDMTKQKHDIIHVPLTGVAEIWAEPPPKDKGGAPSGSTAGSASPPAVPSKLPSDGVQPVLPPSDGAARFE